mmetsp:Transcript_20846/g.51233  ORF Transcript_20846/g.51233 Transcript_20846/m.51233 type:complete len:218 (+) Transcript_20846:660-1313(+)
MIRQELLLPPIVSFGLHGQHCGAQQLAAAQLRDSVLTSAPQGPPPAQKAATREPMSHGAPTMLKTFTSQIAGSSGISPTGDGVVTLFPRRKAGQTRPGGGRGPVVLNLEMLEQFYGVPLHVAAKKLGICQTAIKKVCRRLGIKKWPYKEMRLPGASDDADESVASYGKGSSSNSGASSPTDVSQPVEDTISAARMKLEADDDVQDAVRALLTLQKDC